MTVKWFIDAASDLNNIYDYYVKLNPRAAAILYNRIIDDTAVLKINPYIAPFEQSLVDRPEGYRSLVVAKGKYKVVYFIKNDTVLIVQVFDCRQNPVKLKRTTLKRKQ